MRRILFTAFFIASAAIAVTAQTSADSNQPATTATAAAPAQTDASGQPKKKVKHVYTSEDFKAADPKDVASTASATTSGDSGAATAGDAAKDDKSAKGTKKPAKKVDPEAVAAQQAKVDDLKQQVDGETHVVADIQRLIDQEPSRASTMGAGLAKQQSDLTDLKKQLDSAQSQLDAMKNPK